MKQSLLFLLLLCISLAQNNQIIEKHPKILWAYWDSGLQTSNLMIKLCINNMFHYTKQSNWDFRFLTKQNITNYLSQDAQKRIENMLNSKYYIFKNHAANQADLFRLFLIYENGGMWLDASSFFLQNLTWLQHLDRQSNIINKLGKYPQHFGYSFHQYSANKSKTFDERYNQEVQFFPGLQIWSFMSMKNSKFLKDVIQNLEESLNTERSVLDKMNRQKGFTYIFQNHPYFFTSNYQFLTVLQKKQKQITQNPQKYQNIKYAVQYYKIWSIKSQSSALALQISLDSQPIQSSQIFDTLLYKDLDFYTKTYNTKQHFIKMVGYIGRQIAEDIDFLTYLYCLYDKHPKFQYNNSLLHQYLFKHSPELKAIQKINALNTKQNYQGYLNNQICYQNSDALFNRLMLKLVHLIVLAMAGLIILYLFIKFGNQLDKQSTLNSYMKFGQEDDDNIL